MCEDFSNLAQVENLDILDNRSNGTVPTVHVFDMHVFVGGYSKTWTLGTDQLLSGISTVDIKLPVSGGGGVCGVGGGGGAYVFVSAP